MIPGKPICFQPSFKGAPCHSIYFTIGDRAHLGGEFHVVLSSPEDPLQKKGGFRSCGKPSFGTVPYPIGIHSTYIHHRNQPNVGKYAIHGSLGIVRTLGLCLVPFLKR